MTNLESKTETVSYYLNLLEELIAWHKTIEWKFESNPETS